jgi:predicted acylesterase/phospholipase RssA
MSTPKGYDALVFSSGGMRGIAQLGALECLRRRAPERIQNTRYYIGTSAGAVVATIAATNMSPRTAMDTCIVPFKYKRDLRLHLLGNMFGIEASKSLETFIESVVPKRLTFRQVLNSHGNVLSIIGTDVTARRAVIYDPIRSPDMLIRDALRISCGIPLIFPAVEDQDSGHLLVDGALTNAFPVDIARDVYGCDHILGMDFDMDRTNEKDEKVRIYAFIGSLIDTMVASNTYVHKKGIDICTLSTPAKISGFSFDIGPEDKFKIYDSGVAGMSAFLDDDNAALIL